MNHRLSATLELRDKFSATINKAQSSMKGFGSKAQLMSSKFKAFESSMRGISVGGSIMGVGIAAGLKSSLNSYADLEDQVKRNKAIMQASAAEEALLMEQTKELGRTTKFTAQEVAQAQMYQAMAGMKSNEVLALTPKLLKLSIASGEDLARASDIVTDNLSAFGLELKDVDRLMDTMAATANNSNTTISELGEAYTYVAAASKGFDTMEDTSIMLGILADNGIRASKAGRNLAGIYARLSKVTPDMRKQLEKTGTKLYDANGKFKGLRNIIMESKEALSKLSEEQRNNWLATIAGTEGLKVWKSIMDYSAEGTKKVENAVKNSTGAIDKFAEEMGSTTKNKMAEFKSAVDGVKVAIGEGLAPVAIDFMNNWIKKINEANDEGLFDTTNLENYFRTAESWAKKAVIFYAGVKTAAFAATHPFIAGSMAAAAGGYKLGKKLGNHFALEGRATEIYTKHGGSMSMDEAREEAKKIMEYEEKTKNYTPEQRAAEVKKSFDIINKAKLNRTRAEIDKHIQSTGHIAYQGLRYSDIEKNMNSSKNANTPVNVNLSFGNVTVNDVDEIDRRAKMVGEASEKAFFNALTYQLQTQM